MRTLTDQERIDIVRYRIENAWTTLHEVESHIENGFYNTAVNRMYYACYYAACAILIANNIITKSHDGVKQMLGLHYVTTGKIPANMGKLYSQLFEKRTRGDYEDLFNNDLTVCNEYYPQAKEFVTKVCQLAENWLEEQCNNN